MPLPHALPPVYLQSVARPAAAVRMSLSAELMFPVRMFLPVAPVFPAAGPLFPMPAAPSVAPGPPFLSVAPVFPAAMLSFPSVEPLFPVPETPSAELSFPVQKSLAPASVMALFQGSASPVQVILLPVPLSQLFQAQLSLLCLSVVRLQFLSEVRFLFFISGHSYETGKMFYPLPLLLSQHFPMLSDLLM